MVNFETFIQSNKKPVTKKKKKHPMICFTLFSVILSAIQLTWKKRTPGHKKLGHKTQKNKKRGDFFFPVPT